MKRLILGLVMMAASVTLAFSTGFGVGASYDYANNAIGVEASIYTLNDYPFGLYGNVEYSLDSKELSQNVGVNVQIFDDFYLLVGTEADDDLFDSVEIGIEYFVMDELGFNVRTSSPFDDWKNIEIGLKYRL